MALACRCYHAVGSRFVAKAINNRIISSLHELNNWPFREAIKHGTEIIKGELAQVLSFQELIKFTAVMRSTCQSWGILHSEKRGKLEDQARGFSRVAAAPYPCLLLAVSFFCRVAANALPDLRSVPLRA